MILLNDFQRQWEDIGTDAVDAFQSTGESGWYILGKEVEAFEAELSAIWGLPHAAGVASGLDALEIGLRALGCGPGERVLTTPLSAFATTLAIVKLGAKPIFADTGGHGLIDLNLCRQILRDQPDIRFFVPVHLYGQCLDLHGLLEEFDLRIVEDCAQSIGTHSGIIGQAAATSFYPTKNLGALGDGGALLTRDPEIAAIVRELRDYGQSAKYQHDRIGYNSRLDEVQAAILRRALLPRLRKWTGRRREIAEAYRSSLRLRVIAREPSCWHLFPVAVDDKPGFMAHLKARGVQTGEHYPIAIPDQQALAGVRHEVIGDLRVARDLCRTEVSLPIHPYLTDDEVGRVIDAVNEWRG
jgi:dTDP-3-amino-3,4,6-trideoxy-alpha-D-glucose transaminase